MILFSRLLSHRSATGKEAIEPYIPMRKGFLHLMAVMYRHSGKVLSWRISNTMGAEFCVSALEDVPAKCGKPDIFNNVADCL